MLAVQRTMGDASLILRKTALLRRGQVVLRNQFTWSAFRKYPTSEAQPLCGQIRRLQQGEGPHHAGLRERRRPVDQAVDVALGTEEPRRIQPAFSRKSPHRRAVTDVRPNEAVARIARDRGTVAESPA